MDASKPDPQWLSRLQTVGKAQGRYLWILLVVMIFYAALHARVASETDVKPMKVPVVDLELSSGFVLAFGPALISFLVLIVLGTARAYRWARQKLSLGGSGDWSGEEFDTSPNAIDLAFYTTPRTLETVVGKAIVTVVHFVYPTFLAGALGEAAWLAKSLVGDCAPGGLVAVAVAALLWIPAAYHLLGSIRFRIADVPKFWR
jgi:hypothetical protein